MIDYGYFRHRFDAHENTKLNRLVDEIGVEGYGYYYTLLEIYGAHYSKKKESLDVEIHLRVIANTWRKRVDSCHKVLTKLQLSGLLVVTIKNSTCILNIPNYLEYYGPYKKTKGNNASNKIKENKIKENKKREGEVAPTPTRSFELKSLVKESLSFIDSDELELFNSGSIKAMRYILERYELADIERYFYQVTDYNNNNPKKAKKDIPSTMRNWMEKAKGEGKLSWKEDFINSELKNIFTEALESND